MESKAKQHQFKKEIEALEQKLQALQASDQLKATALKGLIKKMTSPINYIFGASEILRHPVITDQEREEFVNIIINSAKILKKLIDSIKELSGVEIEHFRLNESLYTLNNLMDNLAIDQERRRISRNMVQIESKLTNMHIEIEKDLLKNRQLLEHMFNNILPN